MDRDFKDLGAEMPFSVPDGFFEEMEQHLLVREARRRRRWWWLAVPVAAAVLVFISLFGKNGELEPGQVESLYTYGDELSAYESSSIVELIENDIFLYVGLDQ